MTYKKTWLSYVLWAVFACIIGVMLANYTILFWIKEIDSTVGIGTIFLVIFVFALVVGVYFLIRRGLLPLVQKVRTNERAMDLVEVFAAFFVFLAGLLYRVYLCSQSSMDVIAETTYYHQAMVKTGDSIEVMGHGASYLYTLCLSFVLSFLGNKVIAGVWMQIAIQMITLVLAYFVVRKMVGRIAACTAMLILAFSSVYVNQIFSLTPECIFFAMYLAGMLLVGSYVKDYCYNQFNVVSAVSGALLSGIVIGVLTYLDAVSVTLYVMLAGLIIGIRHLKEGEKFPKLFFSVGMFILSIVAGVCGLIGMFAMYSYLYGNDIMQASETWFSLYQSHLPMGYILYQTEFSIIECFIQVFFSALLVMAFWNHRKEQNCTPWICLMLLLAPTPLAVSGVLSYQVYAIFVWSVLAGIGLQQCFVADAVKVKAESEENKDEVEKMEPEKVEVEEQKPRFIENPLPLPKKHEKREMDYQYPIAEENMKFDIDIKDGDDFDV